jgi:hypothetical protein
MNSKEIAKLQHELVMALGYKKYVGSRRRLGSYSE